eukprot:TRINITY_DN4538_c0_g1_i1.p1 TRINITY_DN4538_c0_g1~~TRINITY_DN4538_c0_g1_i1.p1  ORF type:complete len:594 (+),score=185.27 TRINITY_DN4538_c0_g1_i1:244-1782(+)
MRVNISMNKDSRGNRIVKNESFQQRDEKIPKRNPTFKYVNIVLDCKELDPELMKAWREAMAVNAELTVDLIALSIHQILFHPDVNPYIKLRNQREEEERRDRIERMKRMNEGDAVDIPLEQDEIKVERRVITRLENFQNCTPLRQLKSSCIGTFISVRGTVVRVGNVKPLVIELSFTCSKCSSSIPVKFKDGKYKLPEKCDTQGCKSKTFTPDFNTAITIDSQRIKLQEQMDRKEPGRVPRTVEIELTNDLVDSCVPGDGATISGIVKVVSVEADKGRTKDKNKSMFYIYIDANSVSSDKQADTKADQLLFTANQMTCIRQISQEKNIFRLITNSICPGIYGHEMVKAGMVLTLFGGCPKYIHEKNRIPIRGDPHLLVVGDPGLGKSQMLTAVNNIAPRGVYVCGSYSSTTGLTVTMLKESGSGDYALEAGALVLADTGICCIDEFDKMSNEHTALMEAMEQQRISIAKAGIVANLPARTSVIAAANPVGGHYKFAFFDEFFLVYIWTDCSS